MATAPVTDGRSARSQRTRNCRRGRAPRSEPWRATSGRPPRRSRSGPACRCGRSTSTSTTSRISSSRPRSGTSSWSSGMLVEVPATGPLRSRAETLMRMRSRIYEDVGNVRRAAELQAPFSPTLEHWLAAGRRLSHARPRAGVRDRARRAAVRRAEAHARHRGRALGRVRPGTSCATPTRRTRGPQDRRSMPSSRVTGKQ